MVVASEYVRTTHPSALTDSTQRAHFQTLMFHGYDFDSVMLRIGSSDICSPSGRRAGVLTHSHIAGDKDPTILNGWTFGAERLAVGLSQSQLARAARVSQPNLSAYENGRRSPSPEVLDRIARALRGRPSLRVQQHRDAIRALVTEHHATTPRLFGSVARGDDEAGSDVDLLVEFTDEASLLDEVGLRLALRDLLQIDVDVVAADALRGAIRDRILREAVPV